MVTVAPCCISCDAATAASANEATACVASDACVVWMVISPPCSVAQFCSTCEGNTGKGCRSSHHPLKGWLLPKKRCYKKSGGEKKKKITQEICFFPIETLPISRSN